MMAWDKEKDRALAQRATMGRVLWDSSQGQATATRRIPKKSVPAVANLTKKVRVRV